MKLHLLWPLIVTVSLTACSDDKQPKDPPKNPQKQTPKFFTPKVIYGADNRQEIYQVQDPAILALADSTVALFTAGSITPIEGGLLKLDGLTFGQRFNLCPNEPFINEPSGAFCSGFLVAPDTIVTAGHCINEEACSDTRFVFGYDVLTPAIMPETTPASEVYNCKAVVHSQHPSDGADFAVVKLDREVIGHTPLTLRKSGSTQVGDPLMVIGHPSGIPKKVAGGAHVRTLKNGFFVANLDTYGGNSGSPVINESTLEVEGVLVRGERDFVYLQNCVNSKICPDDACRGEDVTFISAVLPHLSGI